MGVKALGCLPTYLYVGVFMAVFKMCHIGRGRSLNRLHLPERLDSYLEELDILNKSTNRTD